MNIARSNDDAEIIALCRKMLAVCQEEDRICRQAAADGLFKPIFPPELKAEQARLAGAIAKAALPTTPEGIRAMAEVAMEYVYPEDLRVPQLLGDWFKLAALVAAAGKRARIPLDETELKSP